MSCGGAAAIKRFPGLSAWTRARIISPALAIAGLAMRGAETVSVNVLSDSASQRRARVLIGAEMDAAVDPSVFDVVGNLRKRAVLEGHSRDSRAREGDGDAPVAIDVFHHFARRIAQRAVSRWIPRETRGHDVRHEPGLGDSFVIV